MPSAEDGLPLRHAVALGLLQGPTELLPVSSSAHTALIPWLAGWPYARLDGEGRKSFEVALHTGAGAALAIHMRRELLRDAARLDRRRIGVIALSLAPAALAGYTLGPVIERHGGGPRSIAAGLAVGALAMALADRRAAANEAGTGRAQDDATAADGLALGLAQAAALLPGVSRSGATLTAARARGFGRGAAQALSWHAGLPVLFGASALKGARLYRNGLAREQRVTLAAGAGAAFVSTLASARLLGRRLREGQPALPYALYRCLLAALVISRLRDAA
ncbi:MAG: undecaprenyl-diphosphate phosphatase [Solirubrobacteraceae bacterium]|jgi:undecaprenyl-diphosphatase